MSSLVYTRHRRPFWCIKSKQSEQEYKLVRKNIEKYMRRKEFIQIQFGMDPFECQLCDYLEAGYRVPDDVDLVIKLELTHTKHVS
jgi:hypothetical protein